MAEEKIETLIDKLMSAKGDEIKAAREKLGMTQAELAAKAGTNQQTIDRLERGLTRQSKFMPEIRTILKLPFDDPDESMVRFTTKRTSGWSIKAVLADEYNTAKEMPVFTLDISEENGKAVWALSKEPTLKLPRTYPVTDSMTAYGIVVPDDEMSPVLREGEIAVIDPEEAPELGSEVFMLHGMQDGRTAGMLCTLLPHSHKEVDHELYRPVKFWNPERTMLARYLTWPAMAPVVAKFPMPKK